MTTNDRITEILRSALDDDGRTFDLIARCRRSELVRVANGLAGAVTGLLYAYGKAVGLDPHEVLDRAVERLG